MPAGISLDARHLDLCALRNRLDVADPFAWQNVVTCLVTFLLQLLVTNDRFARFDDECLVHVALVVHRNTAILSAFARMVFHTQQAAQKLMLEPDAFKMHNVRAVTCQRHTPE